MKKLLLVLMIFIGLLFLTGCKQNEPDPITVDAEVIVKSSEHVCETANNCKTKYYVEVKYNVDRTKIVYITYIDYISKFEVGKTYRFTFVE